LLFQINHPSYSYSYRNVQSDRFEAIVIQIRIQTYRSTYSTPIVLVTRANEQYQYQYYYNTTIYAARHGTALRGIKVPYRANAQNK